MRKIMDLMVVGFPRTGSTMMAGLLHSPDGNQVLFPEKRLHLEKQYAIHSQAISAARVWGVKEVSSTKIEASLKVWPLERIRKLVMMIRDPVEAMASHWEAQQIQGLPWNSPQRQLERLVEKDLPFLEKLQKEAGEKLRAVRYECFVESLAYQNDLEKWLEEWRLSGNPSEFVRGYERRGGVALRDVSERAKYIKLQEFKRSVEQQTHWWRQRFGYA